MIASAALDEAGVRPWIWAVILGLMLGGILVAHAVRAIVRAFPPDMRAAMWEPVRARPRLAAVSLALTLWLLVYTLYSIALPSTAVVEGGAGASGAASGAPTVPASATRAGIDAPADPATVAPAATDPALAPPLVPPTVSGPTPIPAPASGPAGDTAAPPTTGAPPTTTTSAPPPPAGPGAGCEDALASGDVAALARAIEAGCQFPAPRSPS